MLLWSTALPKSAAQNQEGASEMKLRSRAGMSLVELMFVVVVIGIVTAATLPRIARSRESTTAKSAASVIGNDVEAAFSTAARNRRPVLFRCDCANKTYEVADQTDGTIRMSRRSNSSSGIVVDRLTLSSTSIVIGPNGLASQAFEVAVAVGNSSRRITVSRTGQVRIVQ